ncbi:unnamed protein product [Protopolystoma xenopodis]|uniref:Uncharacterized protein n=1 Tax=Protopolystoma xenopodis TaxID=117903 RepID=A0A448X6R9_9PLAT|nr:unnamed protein product [Protopolystoma xenopodis]
MLTSVPQVPLAGHLYPIQTQAPPPPINIPTVSTAGQLIFPSGLPEACPTALSQQHQQHSAAAFAAAMAAANYYSQPTAANSVGPMATGAMPHSQPPQQQQLMAAAQFASFLHHQQQQQQQSSHTQVNYHSVVLKVFI